MVGFLGLIWEMNLLTMREERYITTSISMQFWMGMARMSVMV